MEEKTDTIHPTIDDLRIEYQAAQNSAQHHDNLIWSLNGVVWAASLVLLGFLLKLTPDRSYLLIVTMVSILGILLIIKVWSYTFQLAKVKRDKYNRCKEIEEKLGLQQHRTVKWPSGRQKKLHSAVMILFILIWFVVAGTHLKLLFSQRPLLVQSTMTAEKIPNEIVTHSLRIVNDQGKNTAQIAATPDGFVGIYFNDLKGELRFGVQMTPSGKTSIDFFGNKRARLEVGVLDGSKGEEYSIHLKDRDGKIIWQVPVHNLY